VPKGLSCDNRGAGTADRIRSGPLTGKSATVVRTASVHVRIACLTGMFVPSASATIRGRPRVWLHARWTGCVPVTSWQGDGYEPDRPNGRLHLPHSSVDHAWAAWIAWQLRQAGYAVELDRWDWPAGTDVVACMQDALARAARMVAAMEPGVFHRAVRQRGVPCRVYPARPPRGADRAGAGGTLCGPRAVPDHDSHRGRGIGRTAGSPHPGDPDGCPGWPAAHGPAAGRFGVPSGPAHAVGCAGPVGAFRRPRRADLPDAGTTDDSGIGGSDRTVRHGWGRQDRAGRGIHPPACAPV
jgi:hypothetical protein